MNKVIFAIDGIGAYPIDFRTPLVWFGLAFGAFAVITLIWVIARSIRWRRPRHLDA